METILYLSSNLIHIYAISIFFELMLGKNRYNKFVELLSFLGYYLTNSLCFLFLNNLVLNLATNIIPLIIISFQYKKSFGQRIFCVLSSCALGMFVDWLVFSILPSDSILVKNNVVQVVIFLIIVFVLKHFIKDRITELKSNHIWLISIISFGTIAIGQLTIDVFNIKSMIVALALLLINFLNFYMYDRDLKHLQIQHTIKLIEASNNAYQNQLKIMNESQQKIRFLKHDMKNHIYKIKKLIINNESDKAVDYIDEMTESMSVNNEYVNTGNNDVDCLLNYKLAIAKEMGTEFICDILLPEKLIITPFDLTTILGNLFDNALNALKNAENKSLIISIKYSKGMIHIDLENTYNLEYELNKQNQKNCEHGLGLLSVEQTLKKYHGIIKRSQTDKKYYVNVFMYNSFE